MNVEHATSPVIIFIGLKPDFLTGDGCLPFYQQYGCSTLEGAVQSIKRAELSGNVLVLSDQSLSAEIKNLGEIVESQELPFVSLDGVRLYISDMLKSSEECVQVVSQFVNIELRSTLRKCADFVDENFDSSENINASMQGVFDLISECGLFQGLAYYGLDATGRNLARYLQHGDTAWLDQVDLLDESLELSSDPSSVIITTNESKIEQFATLGPEQLGLRVSTGDSDGCAHIIICVLPRFLHTEYLVGNLRMLFREFFRFRTQTSNNRLRRIRDFSASASQLVLENSSLLERLCEELVRVVDSDSASIALLVESRRNRMKFAKSYHTRGLTNSETFSSGGGYSHHSISNNCALIVQSTYMVGTRPMARCLRFRRDDLSFIDIAEIPYLITQNTVHDEESAIIVPFEVVIDGAPIKGVIKVGSTTQSQHYRYEHLKEVIRYLSVVGPLLSTMQIHGDYSRKMEQIGDARKLDEAAVGLHFYKTTVRGFLHSISHSLTTIEALKMGIVDHLEIAKKIGHHQISEQHELLRRHLFDGNYHLVDRGQLLDDLVRLEEEAEKAKVAVLESQKIAKRPVQKREVLWVAEQLMESVRLAFDQAAREAVGQKPILSIPVSVAKGGSGLKVEADEPLILEVVNNLVLNAASAIRKSGRSNGNIEIRCRADLTRSQISIITSDNGCGMQPEEAKKAFQYGYSTSGNADGGLGLYFCRAIMSMHGGSLELNHTKPGSGSSFRMTLPIFTAS